MDIRLPSYRSLPLVLPLAVLLVCAGVEIGYGQRGQPDRPDPRSDCRGQRYTFVPNGTTTTSMTVRKGAICTLRFWTGTGAVHGLRLVERPTKGTFGISNNTFAAYQSRNILGADRFVVRVDWETRGTRVFTNLEVSLSVVERID